MLSKETQKLLKPFSFAEIKEMVTKFSKHNLTLKEIAEKYPEDKNVMNQQALNRKVCICVPTTGLLRVEWVMAKNNIVIPVNWSNGDVYQYYDMYSPTQYVVADARNVCVEFSISQKYEWTLFIDHDTCLPNDTYIKMGEYMREGKYPVVSGLYYCKASHPEPLLFRGKGTGYYGDWKFGDKVMVDGIPMGCVMIHNSILKIMYDESEIYTVPTQYGPVVVRRVFQTPKASWQDPETGKYNTQGGTEDLPWCDRVIRENILERAGWKEIAKEKYPFLVDTSIFCQHIDNNGLRYPAGNYKQYKQYKGSRLEELEKKQNVFMAKTMGSQY